MSPNCLLFFSVIRTIISLNSSSFCQGVHKLMYLATRHPFRILTALVFLLASGIMTADETIKRNAKKDSEKLDSFTFKVPVDVVVVSAIVTDKQGGPVKDLRVDDFKVYEDGKPQPIHTFALESYKSSQVIDTGGKMVPPGAVASEQEADLSQGRMISLIVDDLTASAPQYFHFTQKAIEKFLSTDLGPGDLVSLQTASGRLNQPFTSDKDLLMNQVHDLLKKVNLSRVSRSTCPELTDLQAQHISNGGSDTRSLEVAIAEIMICNNMDSRPGQSDRDIQAMAARIAYSNASQQYEESQFRSRNLLSALRAHIRSVRHFEAKKSFIFFSDGFLSDDLRYEIQEVVDLALRSGVIFNTVDFRGLYTNNYEAKDQVVVGSLNSPGFAALSQKPLLRNEDMIAQNEPMRQLANETGGLHIENSNDLYGGLRKIADSQSFYYVLTYASPAAKSDGRYHKIKLEVSRPGVNLIYRKGYYAPKEEISFERRKKEDILEALHAPGNLNEIPVQLSYNYFQVDEARYQLALLTHVNIRGLKFLDEDSRHKSMIHLVVVAFDENDRYVDGLEKAMELNLTDPSYTALLNYGFTSKVDIKVPPGRYKIKAVVREGVHTKMGSINKTIEVP